MNARTSWVVLAALLGAASLGSPAMSQVRNPTLDKTGSTAQPPTTDTPREGCVTAECHPGIKDRPNLHGPILVNGCDACHVLTDPATAR